MGPLLLEYNGPEEGWSIITEAGKVVNPFILTAAGLSYYISQHQLAQRITNLDALGSQQLIQIAKSTRKK